MIIGAGIDIVEIARIERALTRRGERMFERLYTPAERAECERRSLSWPQFAIRFAAKEAGMKAIGTGWRDGVGWRDFEATEGGRGFEIRLSGRALELARSRHFSRAWLGVSLTRTHALAHVLLDGSAPAEDLFSV